MTSVIEKVENKLKFKIKNKKLFFQALTHKSANKKFNNEKLEFLGDRVIGLVLAKRLYDLYPNENEGVLDKRLASLVNRKTCCTVGWSAGIQDFIVIGNKKRKIDLSDEKIISDACEALIAAIYLDKGFEFSKKVILRLWKKQIDKSNITVFDSKTRLQEYSLKLYKKLPVYQFAGSRGPKHKPVFKIMVSIVGTKKFLGEGNSKQQAEQDGAANLLKELKII
tara:strand:+ start:949 stop:1617 length:669 start_codon:yes stop_codon:yes gene_type:complete